MFDLYPYIRPALFAVSPETAHGLTIAAMKSGVTSLLFGDRGPDDKRLATTVAGIDFPNPVGLAAGFDKNAEVADAALKLGFGFVETGTVTPLAQPGNPKPRMFRLSEDEGVINRFGFNNEGLDAFAARLRIRRERPGIVGGNLGANKLAEDRVADYCTGLERLLGLVSYFTVNISSPNTPGLRGLQSRDELKELLSRVLAVREGAGDKTPIFLKIAPDVTDEELVDIVEVSCEQKIDALIVSNTTIGGRDTLKSSFAGETGGLSGKPVFEVSTQKLGEAFDLMKGRMPLIGVGGISSGRDAYEKILNGASLVQIYSMLAYKGPGLVREVKRELVECLTADGYETVVDAVGAKR